MVMAKFQHAVAPKPSNGFQWHMEYIATTWVV